MSLSEITTGVAAFLVAVGGGGAIVWRFSELVGKHWAERALQGDREKYQRELEYLKSRYEAENQRLQGEISKTLHVHRLNFETEFEALKEIWVKLVKLRRLTAILDPSRIAGLSEPQVQQLHQDVEHAIRDVSIAIDDNRPFLTEALHTQLMAACETALTTARWSMHSKDVAATMSAQREAFNRHQAHVNEVANLIQSRIKYLSTYQ